MSDSFTKRVKIEGRPSLASSFSHDAIMSFPTSESDGGRVGLEQWLLLQRNGVKGLPSNTAGASRRSDTKSRATRKKGKKKKLFHARRPHSTPPLAFVSKPLGSRLRESLGGGRTANIASSLPLSQHRRNTVSTSNATESTASTSLDSCPSSDHNEEYSVVLAPAPRGAVRDSLRTEAATRYHLGEIHMRNHDYDGANSCFRQALRARLALRGRRHVTVASTYEKMGDIAVIKREFQRAQTNFDAALKIHRSRLAEGRIDAGMILIKKAGAYTGDGSKALAFSCYREGLEILMQHPLPDLRSKWNGGEGRHEDNEEQQHREKDQTFEKSDGKCLIVHVLVKMGDLCFENDDDGKDSIGYYDEAMRRASSQQKGDIDSVSILERIAKVHSKWHRYNAALEAYTKAWDILTMEPSGPGQTSAGFLERIDLCEKIVSTLYQTNNDDADTEAIRWYETMLSAAQVELGFEHPVIATLHFKLGRACCKIQLDDEAIAHFKKEGRVRAALCKKKNGDTKALASTLMRIGATYRSAGNNDKALVYYRDALNYLAPSTPGTAGISTNDEDIDSGTEGDGVGKSDLNPQDDTSPSGTSPKRKQSPARRFQDSVALAEKLRQCEDVLKVQDALQQRGEKDGYQEDEIRFSFPGESTSAQPCTAGPSTPEVADMVNDMGNLCLLRGSHEKAVDCYKSSLRMKMRSDEVDSTEILRIKLNLARAFDRLGSLEKAMSCLEEVVNSETEPDDKNDRSEVAHAFHEMGVIYVKKGRYDSAIASFQLALTMKRESLGLGDATSLSHRELLGTMQNLGFALSKNGQQEKSLQCFERVLQHFHEENEDGYESAEGFGSLNRTNQVASTLFMIGTIKGKLGRFSDARHCLKQCLDMRKSELGEADPLVGKTLLVLAGVYIAEGKYHDAKSTCEGAWRILKKASTELGTNHSYIIEARKLTSRLNKLKTRSRVDEPTRKSEGEWSIFQGLNLNLNLRL